MDRETANSHKPTHKPPEMTQVECQIEIPAYLILSSISCWFIFEGHETQLFYLDFKGMCMEGLNKGRLFKLQEQTEGLEVGKGTENRNQGEGSSSRRAKQLAPGIEAFSASASFHVGRLSHLQVVTL